MKKLALLFFVVMSGGYWLRSNLSQHNLVVENETPVVAVEPRAEHVVRSSHVSITTAVPVADSVEEKPFAKIIESARKAKSPEEARLILEKALKEHSESPELLGEMGMLYLTGLNQPEKALGYFEQSLNIDGNNGDIASLAANIYVREKMTARGTKFLADLMRRFPDNHTIPVALADILAKQGRGMEGRSLLEDTAAHAQNEAAFLPYLGMMYLNTGNTVKAVETFRKVVEEQEASHLPRDPQKMDWARLDLANAYLAHGNVPEAETIVKGVLERSPEEPFAKELLERIQKRPH